MTDSTNQAGAPSDLITAVVNLVATGPVPLGAYTPAEVAAVGGLIEWLEQEQEPGPEPMAEAVRSLAARDLITTEPGATEIEVRGDLGIALAFQHRSVQVEQHLDLPAVELLGGSPPVSVPLHCDLRS